MVVCVQRRVAWWRIDAEQRPVQIVTVFKIKRPDENDIGRRVEHRTEHNQTSGDIMRILTNH